MSAEFRQMVRRLALTIRRHLPHEVNFCLITKNKAGQVSVIGDLGNLESFEALKAAEKGAFDQVLRKGV